MVDHLPPYQSIGQLLRQAREERALTLDEAAMQTRIRLKYLEALEAGDFSELPSLTHAKGFLRNYARYLHLDVSALMGQF
ncbi:MAG: helix-turn-helix domain-containing protein, partial [Chloroflexi bacterium]|nr:helix-turn-helix domain-containing protein [Chloroflexota bacterium]